MVFGLNLELFDVKSRFGILLNSKMFLLLFDIQSGMCHVWVIQSILFYSKIPKYVENPDIDYGILLQEYDAKWYYNLLQNVERWLFQESYFKASRVRIHEIPPKKTAAHFE